MRKLESNSLVFFFGKEDSKVKVLKFQVVFLKSNNDLLFSNKCVGFPGGSVVKIWPLKAREVRDLGSITGSGRSPARGNDNPL